MNSSDVKVNEYQKMHWIFLFYHKSGYELTAKLARIFDCPSTSIKFDCERLISSRDDRKRLVDKISNADITRVEASNLFAPWKEMFFRPSHQYRIVHFTRDPFDMIVSGFLYHSQFPPPYSEKANLENPNTMNVCISDPAILSAQSQALGNLRGEKAAVKLNKWIADVQVQCVNLMQKYSARRDVTTYNELLLAIRNQESGSDLGNDLFDGLRIEAARTIISKHGGDLLRMTINALYERHNSSGSKSSNSNNNNNNAKMAMRMQLKDFPSGKEGQFVASTKKLYHHLVPDTDSAVAIQHKFWQCVDEATMVQRAVKSAFISNATIAKQKLNKQKNDSVGKKSSAFHITSHSLDSAARASYIDRLRGDDALGPILAFIADIVN